MYGFRANFLVKFDLVSTQRQGFEEWKSRNLPQADQFWVLNSNWDERSEILVTRYVCSSISPGFKYSNAKILCKRRHYINISRNLRKCILEDWMKQKVRQGDFACRHLYSRRADGAEKSDIFSAFFSSTWCKTHELLYFSQPGGLPERTAFKKTTLKLTIISKVKVNGFIELYKLIGTSSPPSHFLFSLFGFCISSDKTRKDLLKKC